MKRVSTAACLTFALLIGISLWKGWHATAWILEGVLAVAVGALVFGAFCLGSYAFHVLIGHVKFANRTLPWRTAGSGGGIGLVGGGSGRGPGNGPGSGGSGIG